MKTCTQCKIAKPLDNFPNSKGRKDGKYPWCKPCSTRKSLERSATPENRQKKSIYDKARYAANPEIAKQYHRDNYHKVAAKAVARSGELAKKNPARRRAIAMAYKARRRSVERAGMTGVEFGSWLNRQAKICHWCAIECEESYHVDHVMPLAKGGHHEAWNLVIACQPCNQKKSSKHPLDWLAEIGYSPDAALAVSSGK